MVVPFPFSDMSRSKRRPALVIAKSENNDLILCQITSRLNADEYAVEVDDNDFDNGTLKQISNVRPNRIFTADRHIVLYRIGSLKPGKMKEVIERIVVILNK